MHGAFFHRFSSSCRISIVQRSEPQQRVEFAKYFCEVSRKRDLRRGGGLELDPDNPALQFLPIFEFRGPAVMLCPLAFYSAVPIAFVAPAESLLLLCNPLGLREDMRLRKPAKRGLLAFRSGIDAKAGGHSVRGNSRVELAGFSFTRKWGREFQIHLHAIGSLVSRKTNIAINAGEIRAGAASRVEA